MFKLSWMMMMQQLISNYLLLANSNSITSVSSLKTFRHELVRTYVITVLGEVIPHSFQIEINPMMEWLCQGLAKCDFVVIESILT